MFSSYTKIGHFWYKRSEPKNFDPNGKHENFRSSLIIQPLIPLAEAEKNNDLIYLPGAYLLCHSMVTWVNAYS